MTEFMWHESKTLCDLEDWETASGHQESERRY